MVMVKRRLRRFKWLRRFGLRWFGCRPFTGVAALRQRVVQGQRSGAAGGGRAGARRYGASAADATLVKARARVFRWRRMMETGRYGTINELASAEKINTSCVSRLLRLTLPRPTSSRRSWTGVSRMG